MLEDLQNYVPGQTYVTAKDMNTLGEVVKMFRNLSGSDVVVDGAGVHFRPRRGPAETVVVRLTDSPAADFYNWKQVAPKADGTYADVTGGRTSADDGPALSPKAGATFVADATTGDVVTIRKAYDPDTGNPIWVIVGGIGSDDAPEYAGQAHQGVANGVAGYAFLPLVNLFP